MGSTSQIIDQKRKSMNQLVPLLLLGLSFLLVSGKSAGTEQGNGLSKEQNDLSLSITKSQEMELTEPKAMENREKKHAKRHKKKKIKKSSKKTNNGKRRGNKKGKGKGKGKSKGNKKGKWKRTGKMKGNQTGKEKRKG